MWPADVAEWREAVAPIGRFFPLVVTDWGRRRELTAVAEIARASHSVCVVAAADRRGLEEAASLVPAMRAEPGAPDVTLVLVDVSDAGASATRVRLGTLDAPVLRVPFDAEARVRHRCRRAHPPRVARHRRGRHRRAGVRCVAGGRIVTVRVIHRPARVVRPPEPPVSREVAAPPRSTDEGRGFPLQMLLPVIGAMSSVVMITVLRTNPLMVIVAAMIFVVAVVGGIGMALTQRGQAVRRRRTQRQRFLEHLENEREQLRAVGDDVRRSAVLTDPPPAALPDILRDPARRWERRRSDGDFLRLRIGTGPVDWHALTLPADTNPVEPHDELLRGELTQLLHHYSVVRDMPATVELDRVGDVSIVGPRDATLGVARALYAQTIAFHAPDDVSIALVHPPELEGDWDGLDVVGHVQATDVFDGPVAARRVAPTLERLSSLLAPWLQARAEAVAAERRTGRTGASARMSRLLVFVDHGAATASSLAAAEREATLRELGITIVHLVDDRLKEPSEVSVRITATGDRLVVDDVRKQRPCHRYPCRPAGTARSAGAGGDGRTAPPQPHRRTAGCRSG